jgi:YVTN family beta-propeller protein
MMKLVRTLVALSVSAVCAHASATATPPASFASAYGVATDPLLHRAFVVDRGRDALSVFDLADGSPGLAIAVAPNPGAILSDSANSRVYVTHDGAPGSVSVIDAASGSVIGAIGVGDHPFQLAADLLRGELYVANSGSDTLSVIDIALDKVVATIPVGRTPNGLAVDSVRGHVYVANAGADSVSIVDQEARAVTGALATGPNPGVPRVDARTGRVLVNNLGDGTVSVLDPAANGVAATLATGLGPTVGILSPTYRTYFVANAGSTSITAIDLDTLGMTTTLNSGRVPVQIAIDEDAGTLFVANRNDGSVTIVDPGDGAIAGSLAVAAGDGLDVESGFARLVVAGDADLEAKGAVVDEPRLIADTAIVADYATADAALFFDTAEPVEKRLLDDGSLGTAWRKTEDYWRVWTAPAAGRLEVCRFYGSAFAPEGTHRHAYGDECEALRHDPAWSYEKIAFYVAPAEPAGVCTDGTEALYRLTGATGSGAPSDRLTTDVEVRDAMSARGWTAEPFACVPPVRMASVRTTITPVPAPTAIPRASPPLLRPTMPLIRMQP